MMNTIQEIGKEEIKYWKMELENKNTFYKNVDEVGQIESVIELCTYFKIVDEGELLWIKSGLSQRIMAKVSYLAFKYLV